MSELPDGWVETTLGEISVWGSGGTPSRANPAYFGGAIPWVTISDLNDGIVSRTFASITDAGLESSAAKLAPVGSILVALYGSIGKLGIAGVPLTTNQAIAYSFPNESAFDSKFLFHYLNSERENLLVLGSGVTQKNIYLGDVKAYRFPLAPRAEQTRIVEKLDELLSDLDAGVAELKAAQKKLGQYRQSLLKAAVEGALTAEWRTARKVGAGNTALETGSQLLQRILTERRARWEAKQRAKFAEQGKPPPKDWQAKYPEPVQPDTIDLPELPEGWVWASLDMLGEIASGVAKGTKRDPDVLVREVPYLRVANVQRGFLDLSEVKTILATERDIAELELQAGDVLFNEGGDRDKLGRGWVWRNEVPNCIHQNHVFRMRPYLPEVLPELISHHGNTFGKTWFQNAGKQTTNLASINMTMLRIFPVPLGPAAEQRELLSQLESQIENLNRQEQAVELGLKQSTAQRKNILKAAFSGQIVPQDPDDEPASVLLERIRAERAERGKQPKARKTKQQKEIAAMVSKLMDVLAEAGDWLPAQEAFRRCGVADGAQTEQVEVLYAELRELDKAGRLAVEPVTDTQGRKLHDRLKLFGSLTMRLDKLTIGSVKESSTHQFKNLKNVTIDFDQDQWVTVVIGWNGTGKSNVLEALAIIFRDLIGKKRTPAFAFQLAYRMGAGDKLRYIHIDADPDRDKDPFSIYCADGEQIEQLKTLRALADDKSKFDARDVGSPVKLSAFLADDGMHLPRYVFSYYSGESPRMHEVFRPYLESYDEKLRNSKDPGLKRLFYAMPVHSQFVLLAFMTKQSTEVRELLEENLGIDPDEGIESVLFVLKQPGWSKRRGNKKIDGAGDERFWGAKGVVQTFLDRLQSISLAPIRVKRDKQITLWNKETTEFQYLFVKDINALRRLVGEQQPAQFFRDMESTYVSELIEEVRIRVRLKKNDGSVTFRELSEGEQQLLTVLGLLRFTAEDESLFLLDEPDTHLNPRWCVDYISYLKHFIASGTETEETSHILLTTHNPLAIAELDREQVQILRMAKQDGQRQIVACYPEMAPRGMGYAAIVTSDMFGIASTLDQPTQLMLEKQRALASKMELSVGEQSSLDEVNAKLDRLGFRFFHPDDEFSRYLRLRNDMLVAKFGTESAHDLAANVVAMSRDERESLAKQLIGELLAEDSPSGGSDNS